METSAKTSEGVMEAFTTFVAKVAPSEALIPWQLLSSVIQGCIEFLLYKIVDALDEVLEEQH